MTAVLVDANVLLDVMTEDAQWFQWSAQAIERAADRYRLVINPVIYAEVSIRYTRIEDLDEALPNPCSTESPFHMRLPFWPARRTLPIGGEAVRRPFRFRIFSLARTLRLPGIRYSRGTGRATGRISPS